MTGKATSMLLLIGIAGCSTIRPRAGFDDVERLLSSRTPSQVAWADDTDGAVTGRLRDLLASELTPDAAVQIALLNSPALLATYERLGIAQADLVQAGLLPNPVLHASVRFAVSGPGPGAELSLLQDVIGMLVIPLRKRVASAEFEAAKLEVAQAVIDLVTDVKTAFYTLQGAQQMVELRRIVAEATRLSADIAGRQHQAGNITDLDLANEQALSTQAKIDLAEAEAAALASREELNALLGLWRQGTGWKIAARLRAPPAEETPREGMESLAVRQRLDLAAARQAVEVQARSLGLTRVTALFMDGAFGADAEKEPGGTWAVGPAIEFAAPIFDQGQAAVGRVQAELRERQRRFAALAIRIRSQVRRARTRMYAARDRAAYFEKVVVPLRHRVVEQSQLHYNAMQIGAFQLLLAKREEIEAARAYVETLTEYWLARTELERAIGGELPLLGGTRPRPGAPAAPPQPDEPPQHHQHHHHGG